MLKKKKKIVERETQAGSLSRFQGIQGSHHVTRPSSSLWVWLSPFLSFQSACSCDTQGSQPVAESFFRTPGGPTNPTGSTCMDFDGANHTSVGTLFVPQRKLEVSTEDVH